MANDKCVKMATRDRRRKNNNERRGGVLSEDDGERMNAKTKVSHMILVSEN